jgi:ComF family protein
MSIRPADFLITAASSLAAPVFSLIFPQNCSLCGGRISGLGSGTVCSECWSDSLFFDDTSTLCGKCGAFESNKTPFSPVTCGRCTALSFDRAFALGPYEKGLRRAIISLKSTPHVPTFLSKRIAAKFAGFAEKGFDTIIPVPLSKKRYFERGFNQAEVIADVVSRSVQLPVDRNSLQRYKHTQMHRVGMDQKAREKTVEKAFAVSRPKMVDGKNILLTDDVFTSGATASACAQALKSEGAQSVIVFTLARAEFRRS